MDLNKIFKEKYLVIAYSILNIYILIRISLTGYILYFPDVYSFNPFEIFHFDAYFIFTRLCILSFLIGLGICIVQRKCLLNKFMLLSIQLFFIEYIFSIFIKRIFTVESGYFLSFSMDPLMILVRLIILLLLLYCLVYFLMKRTSDTNYLERRESKSARFLNLLFDSILIFLLFTMLVRQIRSDGYAFQDIEFMNKNPYILLLVIRFFYYFVLESVFLQTPGKLYNGGQVFYARNRFKSILVRTLSRFIPFEAFSFFGKIGWHDSISRTSVLLPEKEKLSE